MGSTIVLRRPKGATSTFVCPTYMSDLRMVRSNAVLADSQRAKHRNLYEVDQKRENDGRAQNRGDGDKR